MSDSLFRPFDQPVLGIGTAVRRVFQPGTRNPLARLNDVHERIARRRKFIDDAFAAGYRWCPCGCGALIP